MLLDENFCARLSDFGLAREGPAGDRSHVSTAVSDDNVILIVDFHRKEGVVGVFYAKFCTFEIYLPFWLILEGTAFLCLLLP